MFGKTSRKSGKGMKTFAVKIPSKRAVSAKGRAGSKKKVLSFTEWVDQYVKASHGNPV